jgi:hypothetical protein
MDILKEIQALIKGKYGIVFLILLGLLLLEVFMRILPVLLKFAAIGLGLLLLFRYLEKKR